MPELRDAEKSVAQRKLSDEKDLKERSFARALFREPDATPMHRPVSPVGQ